MLQEDDQVTRDAQALLLSARARLDALRAQIRAAEDLVAALELVVAPTPAARQALAPSAPGNGKHFEDAVGVESPHRCATCKENLGPGLNRQLDSGLWVHAIRGCDPLLTIGADIPMVANRKKRKPPTAGPVAERGEMRQAIRAAYAHHDGRATSLRQLIRYTQRHKPASLRHKHITQLSWDRRVSSEVLRMVKDCELERVSRGVYAVRTSQQGQLLT